MMRPRRGDCQTTRRFGRWGRAIGQSARTPVERSARTLTRASEISAATVGWLQTCSTGKAPVRSGEKASLHNLEIVTVVEKTTP